MSNKVEPILTASNQVDPLQPPQEQQKLLTTAGLLTVFLVITTVLVLLYPGASRFEKIGRYGDPADPLTIAYLWASLKSDRGNNQIRLALARQLLAAGEFGQVLAVLTTINLNITTSNDIEASFEAQLILLEAKTFRAYLQSEPAPYLQELASDVEAILVSLKLPLLRRKNAEASQLHKRLDKIVERLADPKIIANYNYQMAPMSVNEHEKMRRYELAASNYLAANLPVSAATVYAKLYNESLGEGKKIALALRHLKTLLAAARPDQALNYAKLYLVEHPQNNVLLDQSINIARQNNDIDVTQLWLENYLKFQPNDISRQLQLLDMLLAKGEITKAAQMADRVRSSAKQLNKTHLRKFAKLYEWSGRPTDALALWIKLLQHGYDSEAETRAISLAPGLNRLEDVNWLLSRKSDRVALNQAEFVTYHQTLVSVHSTSRVISDLQTYIQRHPQNRKAWRALFNYYLENLMLEDAWNFDRQFTQKYSHTLAEIITSAQLLWRLERPEEALELLKTVNPGDDISQELNKDYWYLRADIAWYLDEVDEAIIAYAKLMRSGDPLAISRLTVLAEINGDKALAYLAADEGWKTLGEARYLVQLLEILVAQEKWQEAGDYLLSIEKDKSQFISNISYLTLAARVWQQLGENERSLAYLDRAYQVAPNSLMVQQTILWLLVDSSPQNNQQLKYYLTLFQQDAINKPQIWNVLGAGWIALRDSRQALLWFNLALTQNSDNPFWLAGYADLLSQQGYFHDSLTVKKQVLNMLQTTYLSQSDEPVLNAQLRISLTDLLGGQVAANHALMQIPNLAEQKDWLPLMMEWALRDGRVESQSLLQTLASFQQISFPAWQQLSLALGQNDKHKIESLVMSQMRLPLADKVSALRQIGFNDQSLNWGLTQLTDTLGQADGQQLREVVTSIRTEMPNGASLEQAQWQLSQLTMDETTARYVRTTENRVYDWRVRQFKPSLDDGELLQLFSSEVAAELSIDWLDGLEKNRLFTQVSQRQADDLLSLNYSQMRKINSRLSYDWSVGYGQRDSVSAAMHQLGQKNSMDASINYQLDRANFISSRMSINQFETFDNEVLASGYQFEASWQHKLWFEDPSWTIQADISYLENSLKDTLSSKVRPYLEQFVAVDTFIPEEFCRVGVGSSWQHGEPGEIAQTAPSPHYIVALNVGWQCHQQEWDYSFKLGLGWRIFGDDELSFTLEQSTSGVNQEESQRVNLTYSKYFGR